MKKLQDCFSCTNWDVFRTAAGREDCTVDLDEYASVVTSTWIETVTTTTPYRKYPNQKPWINCDVRAKLRARLYLSWAPLRTTKRPDMT